MEKYSQKSTIPDIVKKAAPAVVSVTISKLLPVFESLFGMPPPNGQFSPLEMEQFFMIPKGKKKIKVGGGSGFIVDGSGLILTNRHVVADPKADYMVVLDEEKKYKAEILAKDSVNDVAVIKINAKNLPLIELGDSSKLELGQTAIAIGNTLGTFRNTVSVGVVSGLLRQIAARSDFDHQIQELRGLIQTDAAINPGNSGGPLIDSKGKAIGINAAMVFGAENVGFALPINQAKKVLDDLKKYGRIRHAFLGIRYGFITKELQERYGLPVKKGAIIMSAGEEKAVVSGGPADKAGLKEKDIILEIQNEKITPQDSIEDFLQKYKIGQIINVKILRNGEKMTFRVKVGERE